MTNNTIRVAETQRDYADERRTETCTRCEGSGKVLWPWGLQPSEWPCPDCVGEGTVPYGQEARR